MLIVPGLGFSVRDLYRGGQFFYGPFDEELPFYSLLPAFERPVSFLYDGLEGLVPVFLLQLLHLGSQFPVRDSGPQLLRLFEKKLLFYHLLDELFFKFHELIRSLALGGGPGP